FHALRGANELESESNITALYMVVLCMSRTESLPSAAFLQTFAPVAQLSERLASNAEVAGEIPAGNANLTGMWLNPNSRRSRLRIWQRYQRICVTHEARTF